MTFSPEVFRAHDISDSNTGELASKLLITPCPVVRKNDGWTEIGISAL